MVDSGSVLRTQQSTITQQQCLSFLAERLVESLLGLLGGGAGFGNFPLHFAGADFILCDAAGLAGIRVDDRRRTGLQLSRSPRCHQDVSIVAVKAFDQLHWDSPLKTGSKFLLLPTSNNALHRTPSTFRLSRSFYSRLPTPPLASLK